MVKNHPPVEVDRCPSCHRAGLRRNRRMESFPVRGPGGMPIEATAPVEALVCRHCGFGVRTDASMHARDDATAAALGLLSAPQILAARTRLGWSRRELSERTGIGTASIFRWETRRKRQSRSNDMLLRMAFGLGASGEARPARTSASAGRARTQRGRVA
jgi:DNA-binding transcriptional regulator YiaG